MICPPYLKPGNRVGLVAPSGRIAPEKVLKTKEILVNWGYEVSIGQHVFNSHFKYAGTDEERLADLQQMLDQPDIKTVFCARGGYGLIRLIDQLDFSEFLKNPKWIIGFSDISVLHAHLNNYLDIASIHGSMCRDFFEEEKQSLHYLHEAITGELHGYTVANHPLNRVGRCEGILSGGNLAILQSLIGSVSDFDPSGKILFIEDTGEDLYRIDRMMWSLKRAAKLQGLSGLIAGQFTDIKEKKDVFGADANEIIATHISEFTYPVMFGFPAGHGRPNFSLYLNKKCVLTVNDESSAIDFI